MLEKKRDCSKIARAGLGAFRPSQCWNLGLHSVTTIDGLWTPLEEWPSEEGGTLGAHLLLATDGHFCWKWALWFCQVPSHTLEAVASGLAAWGVWDGIMAEALFGYPNTLKSSFPSLASWAFGLISSRTQTSGCQQDPLFPASEWLLRGRWLTLGPI